MPRRSGHRRARRRAMRSRKLDRGSPPSRPDPRPRAGSASASPASRGSAPRCDHGRARASAGGEAVDSALEHLLGAARDEQHAQPLQRLLAQPLGQRDQHGDRGQVVVRARGRSGCARCLRIPPCRAASRPGPRVVRPRRPVAAPTATSAGAASIAHHSGSDVSIRSMMPGNISAEPRLCLMVEDRAGRGGVVVGEHDERPLRLRVARAGDHVPCRPCRLPVARRNKRGPLEMSSAIAAVTAAPASEAVRRHRDRSAATPASAPAAASIPITRAYPSRNCSSSTPPSHPARLNRSASHRAACSSPGDPARRSIGASASITSRRSPVRMMRRGTGRFEVTGRGC